MNKLKKMRFKVEHVVYEMHNTKLLEENQRILGN